MKPSLQGQLLIASPRLVDPNFFHTVVLLVQHNEEGALGLVLNRPLQTTVKEMWAEVNKGEDAEEGEAWKQGADAGECEVEGNLHQGGPCEGPLMVVHADDAQAEIEVKKGVYFCTRRDTVEELVAANRAPMKFFVNYAGWGNGQLEGEIDEGSWLIAPATPQVIFEGDEHIWTDLIRAISKAAVTQLVDPERVPDDPSVN